MPAADVVAVCHLVREKEGVSRALGQMQTQKNEHKPEEETAAAPVDAVSAQDEPTTELKLQKNGGTAREGVEATATIPDGLQAEKNNRHVVTCESQEDGNNAKREIPTDGSAGEDDIAAEKNPQKQGQPAVTFPFVAVSECHAVREWVRRGAYTLPAFNITSGRQQD